MMRCTCNKLFCIKHYTPTKHNCTKSIENDKIVNVKDLEPTGAFKKLIKYKNIYKIGGYKIVSQLFSKESVSSSF